MNKRMKKKLNKKRDEMIKLKRNNVEAIKTLDKDAEQDNIIISKIKDIFKICNNKDDDNNLLLEEKNVELVNEVDIEEYKEKEICNININKEEWFNNKKSVIINENELTVESIDKPIYISYKEMNGNFNILPKEDILKLCDNYQYSFSFNVEGESLDKVKLYIIAYDEKSKLYMDTLKANETRSIDFSEDVSAIRVALKFDGECLINLKNTFINIMRKKK